MYIINLFSFDFRIEYESIYFHYLELMHFETELFVVVYLSRVVYRIFSISQFVVKLKLLLFISHELFTESFEVIFNFTVHILLS